MIELKGVSKDFIHTKALISIDLKLEAKKIIGLIGANGSGKTTMLKLISGLDFPTTGQVTVNTIPADRKVADLVSFASDVDMEFYAFKPREIANYCSGIYTNFDWEKMNQLRQEYELDMETVMSKQSKGQRARVKLAVTLSRQTPWYVMDEPFGGLDPLAREGIVEGLLRHVNLQWQSLVVSTHEIVDVENILDELVLLDKGRLIARENVDDIREKENCGIVDWMKKAIHSEVLQSEVKTGVKLKQEDKKSTRGN